MCWIVGNILQTLWKALTGRGRNSKSYFDYDNDEKTFESVGGKNGGWQTNEELDQLDLRFGAPFRWKSDDDGEDSGGVTTIPKFPDGQTRLGHQCIVVPGSIINEKEKPTGANDPFVLVSGGLRCNETGLPIEPVKSILSWQFPKKKKTKNPLSERWNQSMFPEMNIERSSFGFARVGTKLYAISGYADGNTFEVLDLEDLQRGWTLHQIPTIPGHERPYCRVVVVEDRYIFALISIHFHSNVFCSYDTQLGKWEMELNLGETLWRGQFRMSSLVIPGEGSYIVVLGGSSEGPSQSVEAYHVESKKWIQLPDFPYVSTNCCVIGSVGNRYVTVAGGNWGLFPGTYSKRLAVFDWVHKKWLELPPLNEYRIFSAGAIISDPINKWILTGGYVSFTTTNEKKIIASTSLDIAIGIGWAKEKLLLLCFLGKSQKTESSKVCPLEGLEAGIFAKILSYLIVPFQHEVEYRGSIFASLTEEAIPSSPDVLTKKSEGAL